MENGRATVDQRWRRWLWLLPVLLALCANLDVLQNGYGWDDDTIIQNLKAPAHGWNLLLPNGSTDSSTKAAAFYFRPLIAFSYNLDFLIWGRRPFGFHLSVWLAHLLNTALVYFLARELQRAQCIAPLRTRDSQRSTLNFLPLIAASLFAVHPVHAEAVAWIAGRNDVFCVTFLLSSMLFYIRFHRIGNHWFYGLSMILFASALLTKEIAVGLAVLFPLYDYLSASHLEGNSRHSLRRIIRQAIIPVILVVLYLILRETQITNPFGKRPSTDFFSLQTIGMMIAAAGFYFKILVFPYPHHPFIAVVPISASLSIWAGLTFILIFTGMVYVLIRRDVLLGMGLAWTIVFLSPAISVSVLSVASTLAAERYVYGPSAGFIMVASWLFLNGLARLEAAVVKPQRGIWTAAGLGCLALIGLWGWQSWDRNAEWRSPATFWQAAIAAAPEASIPYRNLGIHYAHSGQYAAAEPLLRRAVGIQEKVLGPDHSDFAQSLDDLAELYRVQGRNDEAEPLYRRSLAIWEKTLGPEHSDVAKTLHHLAMVAYARGRYTEAEPLFQRSVAIREKVLGPDHPDVAQSLSNLALLYYSQRRYAEAETLYRRAMPIYKNALGPEHPDTITLLNNLAGLYYSEGKYAEAEPLYEQTLAIREKTKGSDDPDVAKSLNNLALLYNAQRRYAEAEPFLRRSVAIREKTLGPEHPDVATALNNLAGLYYALSRYAEAEPLFRRALEIREKTLRSDHPDLITSLENYAVFLRKMKRDAEAGQLEARVRTLRPASSAGRNKQVP